MADQYLDIIAGWTRANRIVPFMSDPKTYSIQLRLRRITIEDGYVAVPLTSSITVVEEDGNRRIDTECLHPRGPSAGK